MRWDKSGNILNDDTFINLETIESFLLKCIWNSMLALDSLWKHEQNIQQKMKNNQKLQIDSRDGVEISEFVKFWFGIFNRNKKLVFHVFMIESF